MIQIRKKLSAKDRILHAARAEFARRGYSGARIEEIAKKAKANKAMIHYYYNNKDNLYDTVLQEIVHGQLKNSLPNFPAEWSLEAPEKLYLTLYYFTRFHLTIVDPQFHQLIAWELAEEKKHLRKMMQKFFIPRIEGLKSILVEGIESGHFETSNPLFFIIDLISFLVIYRLQSETFKGTTMYHELYGENSINDVSNFVIDHFFKALSVEGGTRQPRVQPEIIKEVNEMLAKHVVSK